MSEPGTRTPVRLPWSGDMTDERYFALDSYDGTDAGHWWDQSQLKAWLAGPLEWAASLKVRPTPAMVFGTACHSLVLGSGAPVEKARHTARSKAGQQEQADAAKRGVTLLPPGQYEAAATMAETCHPVFAEAMPGRPETTMLAKRHTDHGDVYLKAKADWLPDGPDDDGVRRIYDYKTTAGSLDDFGRTAYVGGYDIQAVFYLMVARLVGLDYQGFGWVVQSKTPPFPFRVFRVDGDDGQLAVAKDLVGNALDDVAEAGKEKRLTEAVAALSDPARVRRECMRAVWPLVLPQWAQDRRAEQANLVFEAVHE